MTPEENRELERRRKMPFPPELLQELKQMQKEWAGQPYRPPNGTEGMAFHERFCDRCIHNVHATDDGTGGCEIMYASMDYHLEDPRYPKEWIRDAEGEPTCTSFVLRQSGAADSQ